MYLVTGGAGFIGSNLVAGLNAAGVGPVAVSDWFGHDEKWRNLAKHRVHRAVPPENLTEFVATYGKDLKAIFHLGASSSTTETNVDFILEHNLTLSQALWQAASELQIPFIYASSAATYGAGDAGFDDDNSETAIAALRPLNPYGWSKQMFDLFALSEAARGSAPPQWAGLKFFNVYGPNEYHKGGQRSVAHQLFEQIRDKGSVKLFKSHHPDYDDGGQMRDFVWVGDCVDMMLWLLRSPDVSGIFNCGSGKARSFKDLAEATFAAMGKPASIEYIDTPEHIRKHYQYFTEATMARARGAGFAGNATGLEDGVAQYVRQHLAGDDPYL